MKSTLMGMVIAAALGQLGCGHLINGIINASGPGNPTGDYTDACLDNPEASPKGIAYAINLSVSNRKTRYTVMPDNRKHLEAIKRIGDEWRKAKCSRRHPFYYAPKGTDGQTAATEYEFQTLYLELMAERKENRTAGDQLHEAKLAAAGEKVDFSARCYAQTIQDGFDKQAYALSQRPWQSDGGIQCRLKQWNSIRGFTGNTVHGNTFEGSNYLVIECTNRSGRMATIRRSEVELAHSEFRWDLASYNDSYEDYSEVTYPGHDVEFMDAVSAVGPGKTRTFGMTFYTPDIVDLEDTELRVAGMVFHKP